MTESNNHKYKMTLSLNLLKHLGFGLYSNVPAVLSEAVANAWDADAENVDIEIDPQTSVIRIIDDGHGMSVGDANSRYLHVGYERRQNADTATSRRGRIVMGRKGIGKLSLFSIADTVTVQTFGPEGPHGFIMRRQEIEKQLSEDPNADYNPDELETKDLTITKGTEITLTNLKRRTNAAARFLRRRLARRFSVIDANDGFAINVNGERVTPTDREYYSKIQYLWTFGQSGAIAAKSSNRLEHQQCRPTEISDDTPTMTIQGWIGTAHAAGDLKDTETNESINNIVILIRGKLAQEAILDEFGEGGVYRSYVFGEIHADFLDDDDLDDIATTSRQRIIEDDPRYEALKAKLQTELNVIKNQWTDLRNQQGTTIATTNPHIHEWFQSLTGDHKVAARRLFGRINQLPIDDQDELRQLFISGIMAFEKLKLRSLLSRFEDLSLGNLEALSAIFAQLDDLEATAYYQITKDRIKMIERLEQIVDDDEWEKVIQRHLYDHLWLLDPSWERATDQSRMETTVKRALDSEVVKLSDEEKNRRIDIYYANYAGKHVIIELKRYSRGLHFDAIHSQCRRYRTATRRALRQLRRGDEHIELIVLIGRNLLEWEDDLQSEVEDRRTLGALDATVVSYDELITKAQRAYREYTVQHEQLGRIYRLIERMSEEDADVLMPVNSDVAGTA